MPNWIHPRTRARAYARAVRGGDVCCEVCDRPVALEPAAWRTDAGRAVTLDHLDPAGGNGLQNLQVACLRCNRAKGDYAVPPRGDHAPEYAQAARILAPMAHRLPARMAQYVG